jgi:hypothetical protein
VNGLSDQELLKLIVAADDAALEEGYARKQRFMSVIPKVMEQLGRKFTGY